MDMKDRVVIVTGASSGIGREFARLAAGKGAKLVLAARRQERLDELAGELGGALAVRADLRDPEDCRDVVKATLAHRGRIDVLVNGAGQGLHVPVEEITLDDLEAVMQLNVYAPLTMMQAVLPVMRAQGGGAIVNVSSGTTRMILPGVGGYSATKCALNQLSLTARAEWEKDGIVVSVVSPNVTATEFHQSLRAGQLRGDGRVVPHPPEYVARFIAYAIESGVAEAVVPWGPVGPVPPPEAVKAD
jgi:short-subunit dehydrogenase